MFAKTNKVFFLKKVAFRENLVTISSASLLMFSGVLLAQTQANPLLDTLTQPSITHILFGVSITPVEDSTSDQQVSAKEGDLLNIGDIVRTGEDSIVRIYFPDGTTETLCENTSYQVEESGSEIYEENNDPNSRENIVAAFSRCDLRPRFINRCRTQGGFISRLPKAGERGRIGQENQNSSNYVVKERSGDHLTELTNALNENENGKFKRSDFSSRCSRGEELFANFVSIPEPETPQLTVPVQNPVVPEVPAPVPAPPAEAVTVPETGSSPL